MVGSVMQPVTPTPETQCRANGTRGVTLLELVIAVFVLSIGTLAALRSVDHAQTTLGTEIPRMFATQVALNRAEELRLFGSDKGRTLPNTVTFGPYDWQIKMIYKPAGPGNVEVEILAQSQGQPGGRIVVFAPKVPDL